VIGTFVVKVAVPVNPESTNALRERRVMGTLVAKVTVMVFSAYGNGFACPTLIRLKEFL
jgi:hypothetical protein